MTNRVAVSLTAKEVELVDYAISVALYAKPAEQEALHRIGKKLTSARSLFERRRKTAATAAQPKGTTP